MRRRLARSVFGCRQGVVAIEFALIVPVMLAMFAGLTEICEVLSAERRINQIAVATADLVAQDESVSTSAMTDIYAADTAIIAPYDSSSLKILTCAIYVDSSGKEVVRWCKGLNDTALSAGTASPVTVDAALMASSEDMVVVRVNYAFSSPFTSLLALHAQYSLGRTYFERPRVSSTITVG